MKNYYLFPIAVSLVTAYFLVGCTFVFTHVEYHKETTVKEALPKKEKTVAAPLIQII